MLPHVKDDSTDERGGGGLFWREPQSSVATEVAWGHRGSRSGFRQVSGMALRTFIFSTSVYRTGWWGGGINTKDSLCMDKNKKHTPRTETVSKYLKFP